MSRRVWAPMMICSLLVAGMAAAEDSLVDMLRTDLRADMTALVEASMELNEAQEEVFWPIYRDFERQMTTLGDRRMALIQRFAESGERLAEPEAKAIAEEWFSQQETRLEIRKRAFKRLSKALAPSIAARFIQVENQLGLMIDLQLAAEAPLIRGERE